MANDQPISIKQPSFRPAISLAVLLVVIDALFLSQGVIALLVGLWSLFVGLPRTFLAKEYVAVRAQRPVVESINCRRHRGEVRCA